VHMTEKIRKVSHASGELSAKLVRDPAEEEVAERLGWETGEVRTAQGAVADVISLNKNQPPGGRYRARRPPGGPTGPGHGERRHEGD
jgi:DNA-directed RNA polymerase specialized sigma subunit